MGANVKTGGPTNTREHLAEEHRRHRRTTLVHEYEAAGLVRLPQPPQRLDLVGL
jgi:hypothetical protein